MLFSEKRLKSLQISETQNFVSEKDRDHRMKGTYSADPAPQWPHQYRPFQERV